MESAMKLIFVMVISKVISLPQKPPNPPKFLSPQCLKKQNIAEKPSDCCIIPDLMSVESIANCGRVSDEHFNAPSLRGSTDCAQSTCMFRNNDMLFDNDDIDSESVKQFMDEFAEKYRKYLPAVNAVKERCVSGRALFGPPQWCQADKLLLCIDFTFYDKCPDWLETEGCTALRSHMEECLPYFNI